MTRRLSAVLPRAALGRLTGSLIGILLTASVVGGCAISPAQPEHAPHAQADDWEPPDREATFRSGEGPTVTVDAGHGNWHTISGRFAPFARLLAKDGYEVVEWRGPIAASTLDGTDVLVIANAVKGGEESTWVLPTPPALTDEEIATISKWVEGGGSLLLIAAHMPFPGSVEKLAAAFGLGFIDGYAKPAFDRSGTLTFTRSSSTLVDHPLTRGKSPAEKVSYVKSFTGQAFRLVGPAEPILMMPNDWWVFLPQDGLAPLKPDTAKMSSRDLVQGAVVRYGRGRVAAFGEAGMFTAQTQYRDGEVVRIGMSDPEAFQNAQFVLNVMHWLSGLLN